MNILVLMKAVPSLTGGVGEATTELILNPADLSALEEALKLKQAGGRVTVLTMGIPRCEGLLKEALARGADHAVLVTDRAFAGSDTCATSRILARAVALLGGFDLILSGRKSTDGETGQVGPELATRLGIPFAAGCVALTPEGDHIRCTCQGDTWREELRLPLPALLTCPSGINSPRLPSLLGLRRANKATVQILDAAAIGLPPELTGQAGSPTRVSRSFRKEFRHRKGTRVDAEALPQILGAAR